MALKTTVKISKVNNLSDARYCAGMGVELMGFILDPSSPNVTDPEKFKAITDWIEGVEFVGEFYNTSAAEIKETLKDYAVDYVQINDIKLIAQLDTSNLILHLDSIEALETLLLQDTIDELAYLLLENKEIETISEKGEAVIKEAAERYPLLLGCGLNVDNVEKNLSTLQPTGISLEGGHELRPGIADLDELADMLELLEIQDY